MPKFPSYDVYVTTIVEVRDPLTKRPIVKLSTTGQSETMHDSGTPLPERVDKALEQASGDAVVMIATYVRKDRI